ncbi:MAG: FtsQ-type POTRA domain-containing protein [Gemmatimonadota bacterium]|nr:FtsQ-type POTRA domain-containing protein [Gemmatimonadota bacterium]
MSKTAFGESKANAVRPPWLRWFARVAFGIVAIAVLTTPRWGPPTLARLDFFHVRKVQFQGVRYASTPQLLAALALDSTSSVWGDLHQFATRISRHPMVQSVDVTRTLPATIIVSIVERTPVALIPADGVLSPVDASGHTLPINAAQKLIDAPIAASADTTVLRFLDALRHESPRMYARVIEIRRSDRHELLIQLKGMRVRCRDDVTVDRLEDILPVEESLAQQNQHAVELDLRFQDQVIARIP